LAIGHCDRETIRSGRTPCWRRPAQQARARKIQECRKPYSSPRVRSKVAAHLKRNAYLRCFLRVGEWRGGSDRWRSRVDLQRERNAGEARNAVLHVDRENITASRTQRRHSGELSGRGQREPRG